MKEAYVVMGIVDNNETLLGVYVDITEAEKHLLHARAYQGYDMVELYAWKGKAYRLLQRY